MNIDEFYSDNPNFERITLTCDDIFNTIEEAENSAIQQLDRMYELQKDEIERYFKQFKEQNK
jgi:hypothetical protein